MLCFKIFTKISHMKIRVVSELQLPRPPTDVRVFEDRIYTATKGKRVFFTTCKLENRKSVLFSSQVNSLASSDTMLYCGCQDGILYGLSKSHKTGLKSAVDVKGISRVLWDGTRGEIFVASNSKRVTEMGENGIVRNTFYGYDAPVTDIDITPNGTLCSISQNSQDIKLTNINNVKEPRHARLSSGFPEILKAISNDYFLSGTLDGFVYVYKMKGLEQVQTMKASAGICSICVIRPGMVMLGLVSGSVALYKFSHGNLEFIEELKLSGIPVAFSPYRDVVVVATSREMRMGRWNKKPDGKNAVLLLQVD